MSDCDRIFAYMQEHGSITQMDAYRFDKPCTRLAARIADIKRKLAEAGSKDTIAKVMEDNADGTGKHARYYIKPKEA